MKRHEIYFVGLLTGSFPCDAPLKIELKNFDSKSAKHAFDSVMNKYTPYWPGDPLLVDHFDFGPGFEFSRIQNMFGVAAAKRAFDSILNGHAN